MLTDEQAKLFVDANFAAVATVNADGSPQLSIVWVDWDGEHVLFNTAAGRVKPRNVARGSEVAVLAMESPHRWVSVTGPAELVEEGAREHANKLAKKYTGRDEFGGRDRRLIVRVTPKRVNTYGFDA